MPFTLREQVFIKQKSSLSHPSLSVQVSLQRFRDDDVVIALNNYKEKIPLLIFTLQNQGRQTGSGERIPKRKKTNEDESNLLIPLISVPVMPLKNF